MEFREVVRRRRMVRHFTAEPVDPAVVDRALQHAVRAPSAGHSQGWAFVVLDTPADVCRYWQACVEPAVLADPGPWLAGMTTAPVLVVPCSSEAAYLRRYAEPDKALRDEVPGAGGLRVATAPGSTGPEQPRWGMPYWHLDTAMASLLVLLTAVDEGLGGCFFGIPPARQAAVCETLGIPPDHEPIGVIALGHRDLDAAPSGSPTRRPRRPLAEVVHRGSWNART